MEFDLTESVACPCRPDELWPALLEPDAVTGFLGVAADIRNYRPDDDAEGATSRDGGLDGGDDASDDGDVEEFLGHTFTIVGIGGGLYHAAFDEIVEHERLAYAIWRDDTPEAVALLTFQLHPEGARTVLSVNFALDMPIESIFGAFGTVMMPIIEPMAGGFIAHRLRTHLRNIAQCAPTGEHGARDVTSREP